MKNIAAIASSAAISFSIICLNAFAEDEANRQYKTRDEKLEAAKQYEITEWLSVSALAEVEQINQRYKTDDGQKGKAEDFSKSMDIEVFIEPTERTAAELVFEFDDDKGKFDVDEAVVKFDLEPFELELGKLYLPVGEYYSHFISGAALEFAETRAHGVVATYIPKENLELALFAYDGKAQAISGGRNIAWGFASEVTLMESLTLGLGYQSDLADAEEIDLSDNQNRYEKRVDGIGFYGVYDWDDFEVTAEYSAALDTFREFDSDRDKPSAWNIEFAHYPSEKFEWALRYAGSNELEDAPQRQAGIGATWHAHKKLSLSLEYLENDYKSGLVETDDEKVLKSSHEVGGRITVLF